MTNDLKRLMTVLGISVCPTLFSGCELPKYQTNVGIQTLITQKLMTPNAFEHEVSKKYSAMLTGIPPTERPVGGRAMVAIPTVDHIERRLADLGPIVGSREWRDALKRVHMNGYEAMYRCLQRRGIFDEVQLVHNDHPESAPFGHLNFLIYMRNATCNPLGAEPEQWYIKTEGQQTGHPIAMDMAQPEALPRILSWLDSVAELARAESVHSATAIPAAEGTLAKSSNPAVEGLHWAVVIGVSKYADTSVPALRYAAADAQAFHDWAVSPSGGKYAPSRVKLLVEEQATSENMKDALFVWLKEALAEDMVVIYFAGHGSPESPDSPNNLFLLPYDARYDSISITGFPMWDIQTALKRYIKAKKVVVIVDACHSGGVGQSFDVARRANRGLKINRISTGIHGLTKVGDGICVISASDDGQFSQESKDWGGGHGVFTHFLLQGLEGQADYNKDTRVTLGELIPYLSEQVRRATKNAQSPIVAGQFDPALSIAR